MRIISDFHDYYDAVQATGQDQTLIYSRKREESELLTFPFPVLTRYFWRDEAYRPKVQQYIVGFCGKIYPVVELTPDDVDRATICYGVDEVDDFVARNFRKKAAEEYWAKTSARQRRHWNRESPRDSFAKYFTECAEKKDAFGEIFLARHCPVFIGIPTPRRWKTTAGKIIYNACLKDLEFFRLIDTFTAFQEIAMFLGGLAVPLKEIPSVPDKIMVGIKGFDKWSFRKPPQDG
jgi:hypothetical protein